jgi:hypothetical protein
MAEATDERTDLIRSLVVSDEEEPGLEDSPGKQAAIEVADAKDAAKVAPEVQQSALDWLLSDDPEEDTGFEKVEIDVAPPGRDSHWITWTFRPLNAEELKAARRMAVGGNRQQRRAATTADPDLTEVNARIVQMATIDPDLNEAAQKKGIADPVFVLKHRFRNKPGLIDQLASRVLTISGYEDEAIRDPLEMRAAGS